LPAPMDKWLEITLAIVLIGATLDFGGVKPLTYTLAGLVLILAVLLRILRQTLQGALWLPLPIWPVLFTLWVGFEAVPLPSALIRGISPAAFVSSPFSGAGAALVTRATLSIYPHATYVSLTKLVADLSAFVLAAYVFDSRRKKSRVLRALVVLGCVEAAYGIVQYLTGWNKIFAFTNPYSGGAATGTYINRNHFAGLLELTLPFVLGSVFYVFQYWSELRTEAEGRRGTAEATVAGFRTIFYLFLVVIVFVAVIFSESRGGIVAALFSIFFASMLAQIKAGQRVWMLGAFSLVCVLGYGLWIGLDPVLVRFEQLGSRPYFLSTEERHIFWKDDLRLIRDYPLMGTGLGTFKVGYRRYQTSMVNSTVDHAHNDYLEFASETGLPGAALLFLPIFGLLARMVIAFLRDPRRYRRAVLLGCIGGTVALLTHSITDFNLQIPANALIFSTVLGIGYKAACLEPRMESAGTEATH
jgi:O-antigen ligase